MAPESKSFLRQIYPEEGRAESAEIDLVAVHGLDPLGKQGHAYNTWTCKSEKEGEKDQLWLRDFLPQHTGIPKLRVLLFGYNASAAFNSSTTGMAGAASNLLDQLRYQRQSSPNRPIVFVCHSLGGIVVKQALIEAHNADEIHGIILKATKGVVFFSTPHRGGNGARLGDAIVRVIKAFTGNVRNDIMESLRKDSFLTNHLQLNFARRAKNLRVLNFIETQPVTEVPGLKHYGLVVPRTSAALGWREPDEYQVLMEASHITICKFPSTSDELYKRVADHMSELLTWATQPSISVTASSTQLFNDHPPPSYSSLSDSISDTEMQQRARKEPDSSTEDDLSEVDEMQAKWFNRIRSVSPFRPPSQKVNTGSQIHSQKGLIPSKVESSEWPIVMLPYPQSPSYVNRSRIWERLLSVINQGQPIVLNGFGGSGKTQLAIQLAYWFHTQNPDASIMWIHATSIETCLAGMRSIASRIGIQNEENVGDRLIALKDYLQQPDSGRWLMVFDSADEVSVYDAVSKFLPYCKHGQLVFTSRRRGVISDSHSQKQTFELSSLTSDEGTTLVATCLHPDILGIATTTEIERLLRKLDYLPLAITQAVAFMNKNKVLVSDYLKKISDDTLLSEHLSQNYITGNYISGISPPVYSTWKTSFEALQRDTPQAVTLLGYLSFLEAKSIPLDLIEALLSESGNVTATIMQLETYSLAEWNEDRPKINLHGLLQIATQRWLQETSKLSECRQIVLSVVSQSFPDAGIVDNWRQCDAWLPHAVKLLRLVDRESDLQTDQSASLENAESIDLESSQNWVALIASLKMKIGYYYYQMGEYARSLEYLEQAYDSSRQNLGTMHEITTDSQEKLIHVLRFLGHQLRAFTSARDLKRARKAKFGRKHRDTITSYRIYSLTLQDMGKWKDGLDASEKALKGCKELYGKEIYQSDVLRCYRRAASCCIALGDYARAERLLTDAIEGYEQRNESESINKADCLYPLSSLRASMGNFTQSEIDARQCYELRRRITNKNHPNTLKAYWMVGVSLQGQQQWQPALEIFRELLNHVESTAGMGKSHNYWFIVQYSIATLLEDQSSKDESILEAESRQQMLSEAKQILEEIVVGRNSLLGEDHLDTLTAKARLASVKSRLGNLDESEKTSLEVLKVVTSKPYRRLGVASAIIAWTCLTSLRGCALERAKELKNLQEKEKEIMKQNKLACGYSKVVFEESEKMLGRENPRTMSAVMDYVECLDLVGDEKAAQKIRRRFDIEERK